MRKVAIITARGGSKRIPRKNIKSFLGKPIISYSIEAALDSKLFDEVMVSTDDEEIAQVAKNSGAQIPFLRSPKNADDFATTVDVIIEVLQEYKKRGDDFAVGCCLYPTAPFITSNLLQTAHDKLITEELETVFPVISLGFPIQRALKLDSNNKVAMFYPEYIGSRSQDLEKAYYDAGQFYWFDSSKLLTNKKLWSSNSGVIVLNEMQAQDIDTFQDWDIAEFKFKLIQNAKK